MSEKFSIPEDRRGLIVMAKVAEQCERYDEMLVCLKRVMQLNPVLALEEKNLLSVAYKNVVGARRAPWRTLQALEGKAGGPHLAGIKQFKARMESEIGEVCGDIFKHLEELLIPKATDDESKVFYLKLKADYHRYYVEVLDSDSSLSKQQCKDARKAYEEAMQFAGSLEASSPIVLGLKLNFSVFHYEIEKEQQTGYDMANAAFQSALPKMEELQDEDYRESATIMSLLRDNLDTWAKALGIPTSGDTGMEVEDC